MSAAVNVNQYHAKVSDTMAYSREQRLITVPDSQPRPFGKIKIIIPNGRG